MIVCVDDPLVQRSCVDQTDDWYRPQGLVHALPELESVRSLTPEESVDAFTRLAPICGTPIDGVRGRLRHLAAPSVLDEDDYVHATAITCPDCSRLIRESEHETTGDGNRTFALLP